MQRLPRPEWPTEALNSILKGAGVGGGKSPGGTFRDRHGSFPSHPVAIPLHLPASSSLRMVSEHLQLAVDPAPGAVDADRGFSRVGEVTGLLARS